jgi:hypothetical protein
MAMAVVIKGDSDPSMALMSREKTEILLGITRNMNITIVGAADTVNPYSCKFPQEQMFIANIFFFFYFTMRLLHSCFL